VAIRETGRWFFRITTTPKRAYPIGCALLSDRQRRSQRERVSPTARRSPLSACAVLDGMVRVCCV
jgi:hypothetical protein